MHQGEIMICKKCGAKNSDTREKCFHCGAALYSRNIGAERASEKSLEKAEKNIAQMEGFYVDDVIAREDPAEQELDDIQFSEAAYDPYEENYDDAQSGAFEDDPIENDDTAPEEITEIALDKEDNAEQYFESAKPKKNVGFTIAIWVLVVVFIIVAIIVGSLIYSMYIDNNEITDPNRGTYSQLNLDPPTIKKLNDKNGINYINAVFYGEPGDRLYLGCNDTYHTFIENTLELNLYLEDLFLPEYEFRESTVNANLNASYVRDNKKYAYNISSFEMSVPPAEFELLSPSEQTVKAYRDKYEIKLWTTTDSKVFLNNNNITSYMDGTGNITYNIDVKEDSSTTYQIEIVQPYHTPKSEVFIISRDALKVDLSIATSSASVINEKSIVISGSTEPGAEITSNLPILQLDKNDLYNTFTVTLDLSGQTYGQLEAMITATNEKGSSTKSHVFWYWPAESAITSSASAFNSAIASDPGTYRGRNILITSAKVVRNVSANKFEVVCTYNDIEYNLIIDYPYKQTNITVDSSYRIFAAVDGALIDGKPVFRAWYIYDA